MYPFFRYSFKNHYFEYSWYNFELLRLLGSAPHGGCDAAEFLETIQNIRPNDAASWEVEFLNLAQRTEAIARDAESTGLRQAARMAYLRASNYHRVAQYLFPAAPSSNQAHFLEIYQRSISNFKSATKLFEHPVHQVSIPHTTVDGRRISMPGWLYHPVPAHKIPGRKTPVVICIGGADSTQEELYFLHAAEGPGLGYAVLTFDGPGQGLVLRRDKVYLRPDYEKVMPDVLDWLSTYSAEHPEADIDLDAIALTGQSMGGFLALRAAADPRIKAVVAIDAFYDLWDVAMTKMPPWMVYLWEKQFIINDAFIDWAARTHGKYDVATRYSWGMASGMFGTEGGAETLRNMKNYTLKTNNDSQTGCYLSGIHCPVFISGVAADKNSFAPLGTAEAIHRGLCNLKEEDKEVWVADTYAGGGGQGKVGAWSLLQYRTYKFLDDKLQIVRDSGYDERETNGHL